MRGSRWVCVAASVPALAVVLALALAAVASAAPAVDVSGSWAVTSKYGGESHYAETYSMNPAGVVTGKGPTWPVHGTVNGYSFEYTDGPYEGSSYESHVKATIAANGNSYEGTFEDTNGTKGTIVAERTSGSGGGAGTPGAAGVQVSCSYEVAPNYFTCTAQVGDASGENPPKTPTGSVAFSVKPGGEGLFPLGTTCTLGTSPGGGPTSFCSARYQPGIEAIPPGEQPPIVASYSGDGNFKPATGEPKNIFVANPVEYESNRRLECGFFWTSECTALFGKPSPPHACLALTEKCHASEVAKHQERLLELEEEAFLESLVECGASEASASSIRAHAAEMTTYKKLREKFGNNCEIEAIFKSDDAEVKKQAKAALEWDINRRALASEIDQARADLEESFTEACKTALSSGETCPASAANLETIATAIDDFYNRLKASIGHPNSNGEADFNPEGVCEHVYLAAYTECVAQVEKLNKVVNEDFARFRQRKTELGLTVPKPEVKAQKSSIGEPSALAARARGRGNLVLAAGHVTLKVGKKGKLRIVFPAAVRKLLRALGRHQVRTIRATLTIRTSVFHGLASTRTVHVRLRLRRH